MFFDYQHFAGLLGCYFSANYFVVYKCKTINSLLYDGWDVNLLVKGTHEIHEHWYPKNNKDSTVFDWISLKDYSCVIYYNCSSLDGLRRLFCLLSMKPQEDGKSLMEKLLLYDTQLWKGMEQIYMYWWGHCPLQSKWIASLI